MILRYLRYYSKARTRYNIHSPFLYEFISQCFDTSRAYYPYDEIEILRTQLLRSKEFVKITDYGAGSHTSNAEKRTIAEITKTAASSAYQGAILFNMVQHLQPKNILELGTSLGIGSLYLAKADSLATVHTIEGSEKIAHWAQTNFIRLKAQNIKSHIGQFDLLLPEILDNLQIVDLGFIDGNHSYDATKKYFELLLNFTNEKTVLIFDDIHWSSQMEKAWNEIIAHERVSFSIDLFYFGIVFFKTVTEKPLHISYIPLKYKPWKIGLFGQ